MITISGVRKKLCNSYLKVFNLSLPKEIFVAKGSKLFANRMQIGKGSRINGKCVIKGAGLFKMGNFCAVGWDVKFITSNHEMTNLNLNYRLQKKLLKEKNVAKKKSIEIGHNVWIGDSVIVLPGVEIGNGAVVGAGTIVTKSIPKYSICVGNPGKIIGTRFEENLIAKIEETMWWDWEFKTMKENIALFTNVNQFFEEKNKDDV